MLFRKHLFSSAEKKQIVAAITEAELRTSGEIRVHIEPKCYGNVLARAAEVFAKLEMHKTEQSNGVLIYLAYDDKRFAIIGDKGINNAVPVNFWDTTKEVMSVYFKQGNFKEGVMHGIKEAGIHLAQYFPHTADDKNELSNEISEG